MPTHTSLGTYRNVLRWKRLWGIETLRSQTSDWRTYCSLIIRSCHTHCPATQHSLILAYKLVNVFLFWRLVIRKNFSYFSVWLDSYHNSASKNKTLSWWRGLWFLRNSGAKLGRFIVRKNAFPNQAKDSVAWYWLIPSTWTVHQCHGLQSPAAMEQLTSAVARPALD